jgi:hypothetical protein
MWAANTTEASGYYPNRIRWSLENSPENWDEDDYFDIVGGGNGITGMAVVSGQLVVFKPNAVYVVFGYDYYNFQVVELTTVWVVSAIMLLHKLIMVFTGLAIIRDYIFIMVQV